MITVYVELLDEGVPVWRPVPSIAEGGSIHRLLPLSVSVMQDEVWAFPPESLVVAELRSLSDGPVLVAVRLATVVEVAALPSIVSNQTGIDFLITRGPVLEAVLLAIQHIAGVDRQAIHVSGEPEEQYLSILDYATWATVYTFTAGEFGFKVDLNGIMPRDYQFVARGLAKVLNTSIAWPDESSLSISAFIMCVSDGKMRPVMIDDASDAECGFTVIQQEGS